MKKYSFLSILLMGLLVSCFQDILEEKPTSFVSPSNFYQNETDAQAALNGAYAPLIDLYNSTGYGMMYGDHGTDLLTFRPGHPLLTGVGSFAITSQEPRCQNLWEDHYDWIKRINSVLTHVPDIDMNEITKGRILGEAYFLRALAYFNLVRAWGDVPLVLQGLNDLKSINVPRTASVEVYAQIISDLKNAETMLENVANNQRATSGAAKALLGKVYLQMAGAPLNRSENNQLAVEKLKEVIQSNVYTLLPSYSDVFAWDNENNNEIIFAVQYLDGGLGLGGNYGRMYGPVGNYVDGGAIAFHNINTEFALSFNPKDSRLAQNVAKFNISTGKAIPDPKKSGGWRPWKWHKPVPVPYGQNDDPIDFPVLRYSDVLLMYAEAVNNVNNGPTEEAYQMVNMVRNRANLANLETSLSKAEFLDALIDERSWELCYEGHRRSDLIRTGKLIDKVKAIPSNTQYLEYRAAENIKDFHVLWPIPQREMDLNPNLVQNPGY